MGLLLCGVITLVQALLPAEGAASCGEEIPMQPLTNIPWVPTSRLHADPSPVSFRQTVEVAVAGHQPPQSTPNKVQYAHSPTVRHTNHTALTTLH